MRDSDAPRLADGYAILLAALQDRIRTGTSKSRVSRMQRKAREAGMIK